MVQSLNAAGVCGAAILCVIAMCVAYHIITKNMTVEQAGQVNDAYFFGLVAACVLGACLGAWHVSR